MIVSAPPRPVWCLAGRKNAADTHTSDVPLHARTGDALQSLGTEAEGADGDTPVSSSTVQG